MNQLPANVEKVSDIVKVLNGGIEFYKNSIHKVTGQNIQAMFRRMIEEKQQAVTALKPYLPESAQRESNDADWIVRLRSMYSRLREALESPSDQIYIEQLEEVEDRVLRVIDSALETDPPQHYACELRRIRTRMQQCHDEMRSLQHATAC
ncbi:PA2169 family four-helix-bundle protein [Salinimonas sp. HHU 13199]|uniref:PA2169 family four-helix-bundle protein n=1 Tax=Salinimonas profundi TaxID=2729140 RepID=A0ABR8LGV4_9ALTE|nr:PA2169 family four-helix-bundle protein [Salinimonas profundi]MBD3584201.1 PA2169 family four-helix-bundle protein [Salinimonas profundi]